jgi:DNA-binding GntR family transcriptional regulator
VTTGTVKARQGDIDQKREWVASVTQLKEDPAARIRKGIESGRFMPNERLIESELAEWLGTNRANIRLALGRLEQEGLVICEPNKGARVRLVSQTEAIEIIQVRSVLEGLVAREAAKRAVPADKKRLRDLIAKMRAAISSGDLLAYSDINSEFHAAIGAISGHKTSERLLKTLNSQIVRFQYRVVMIPGRPQQSFAEHKAIFDAINDGDGNAAESAMRKHLLGTQTALTEIMSRQEDEEPRAKKLRA